MKDCENCSKPLRNNEVRCMFSYMVSDDMTLEDKVNEVVKVLSSLDIFFGSYVVEFGMVRHSSGHFKSEK